MLGLFRYFLILHFFLCLVLKPVLVTGQGGKVYKGPYETLTGLKGLAEFEFSEEGKARIKNGEFKFVQKQRDTVHHTSLNKLYWEGSYEKGRKEGEWTYETLEHNFELFDIEDYEPDYQLSSLHTLLNANFEEDIPEGAWDYTTTFLSNGKKTNNGYLVKCTFNKGKIDGKFTIRSTLKDDPLIEVACQVEEGLLEGEWSLTYKLDKDTITEKREFIDGILIHLRKTNQSGDTLVFLDYPHSMKLKGYLIDGSDADDLANAPLSLHFSDGYPRNSQYLVAQEHGNVFIGGAIENLLKNEFEFLQKYGLPMGTNRMYYELTSAEEEALEEWKKVEYNFRRRLDDIESLQITNFLYTENDTLKKISAWEKAQIGLLEYIKPWNHIFLENELHFYYREGLLADYVRGLLQQDTIRWNGDIEVINYAPPETDKASFVFYILQNIKERTLYADSLYRKSEDIIEHQVKEDRVELHINTLFERKNELDSLYRTQTEDKKVNDLLSHISNKLIHGSFDKTYHDLLNSDKSVDIKSKWADSLSKKMDLAKRIFEILQEAPDKAKEIDELYTTYKFDPYTFSENVPVRRFRRLYNRVAEDFFSELIVQALQDKTIIAIYEKVHLIEKSQDRLKYLIETPSEADKVDGKIKRNTSMEKVINLLKI